MKIVLALALAFLTACASLKTDGELDLAKVADQVALVRADVADLLPLASDETRTKVLKLDRHVFQVENALRAAAAGGPVSNIRMAAFAALNVADELILELQREGKYTGDWALYVGLARIALRHLAAGQPEEASEEMPEVPNPT